MAAWNDEESLILIDIYRSYSLLWDPKHENHFKKNLKNDAWRSIGVAMGRPADDCRKKMINLLGSYRRERSKENKSCTTGKGAEEVYNSRWFAYEALAFLRDRDQPRGTLNTETENVEQGGTETEAINQYELQNEGSLNIPKAPKRARLQQRTGTSNMMTSAFEILQTAANKLNALPSEDDEVTSFFKYVTAKVKTYSSQTKTGVQQAVFDILMKADRGFYERTSNDYYSSQQQFSVYGTPPTTGMPLQSASVFPTHSLQPQLTQLTSLQKSPSSHGVVPINSLIHVPTCTDLSNPLSTPVHSPLRSPSEQSSVSVGSNDFVDYV